VFLCCNTLCLCLWCVAHITYVVLGASVCVCMFVLQKLIFMFMLCSIHRFVSLCYVYVYVHVYVYVV